jgi:hypothetical protein
MSKTARDLANLAQRLRKGNYTPEDIQVAAKMIVFYEHSFQQLCTTLAAYNDFVDIMGLKSRADAHIRQYFDEAAKQPQMPDEPPAKPKRKRAAKRRRKTEDSAELKATNIASIEARSQDEAAVD